MTAAVRAPVMKEVRALLPAWAACTCAVAASVVLRDPRVLMVGVLAYGFGSIALGAQSVGHEYTHRTLGLLLSQPSERRRLALIKFGVLATMLVVLAAVAAGVLFDKLDSDRSPTRDNPALLILPILCGLFVAPWLTMACRSPLAGVVFTVSLTGLLLLFSQLAGTLKYGLDHPDAKSFGSTVWMRGMMVLVGVGAVLTWRAFMRLEAIDSPGRALTLPSWLRTAGRARGGHRLRQLAKKELHLQHMTFAIAGLYVAGWAALSVTKRMVPEFVDIPVEPIAMVYLVLLSMLIGSLASAEEREFGTLEWQTLLPMAAWQQWAVKVVMAWALALLLTVGLPLLLNAISSAPESFDMPRMLKLTATIAVALTTLSLYVSSCSTGGVRAMVGSFPVAIVGFGLVYWIVLVNSIAHPAIRQRLPAVGLLIDAWSAVLAVGLMSLVLWFGFVNHRSSERSFRRIGRQVMWAAAFVVVGSTLSICLALAIRLSR